VIHFLTITLNGLPFIRYHIEMMRRLNLDWRWYIVEGVADLTHDTGRVKANGATIPADCHNRGLSADGTAGYLDGLTARESRVKVYRPPSGRLWDGKIEMINRPLADMREPGILWQIDSDELWTAEQVETLAKLFERRQEVQSAHFWSHCFVGPDLVITTRDTWGNRSWGGEWHRAWRYQPGDYWICHEPPILIRDGMNLAGLPSISHDESGVAGLVFQHYAYATPEQAAFKEKYYGQHGAVAAWEKLQRNKKFPARLADFFPWVTDGAMVDRFKGKQLAIKRADGWHFDKEQSWQTSATALQVTP
jgi:hypothetical protein